MPAGHRFRVFWHPRSWSRRKAQIRDRGTVVPAKRSDENGGEAGGKPDNPYQEGASTNARSKKGWAKEELARRKVLDMCFAYHTEGHCKFGPKCKYLHDTATSNQRRALREIMERVHAPTQPDHNDAGVPKQALHHEEYEFYQRVGVCPYFTKYGHCRRGGKCWWKHEPIREVLGALNWDTLHACCLKTRAVLPKITGMVLDLPYHEIGETLWNNATRDRVTEEALQLLEESRIAAHAPCTRVS